MTTNDTTEIDADTDGDWRCHEELDRRVEDHFRGDGE